MSIGLDDILPKLLEVMRHPVKRLCLDGTERLSFDTQNTISLVPLGLSVTSIVNLN
jgi:hypothetical protein